MLSHVRGCAQTQILLRCKDAPYPTGHMIGWGCTSKCGSPVNRMLCQLHTNYSRWDSNPQSPPYEGGALSIRPHEQGGDVWEYSSNVLHYPQIRTLMQPAEN